jgi:ComF family protein
MLTSLQKTAFDLLHFFYPHTCAGCGEALPSTTQLICVDCLIQLPETNFQHSAGNPVERLFYGRLKLRTAMASYFFSKKQALRHIIHAFKYEQNREVCIQMGKWMGVHIKNSERMFPIDFLMPIPVHSSREKKRGYNQALLLCEGIEQTTGIPMLSNIVQRAKATETQTRKGRSERWKNVAAGFYIEDGSLLQQKHLLLIDDVITTGATIEACGSVILKAQPASLSIAALAWASE